MLHLVRKQVYKFKLPKQWKIYDIFYVSLLEQDNTKNKRVDKKVSVLNFDTGNSKEQKVEAIRDNAVYGSKAEGYLPGFYYLVVWKSYLAEQNT